MPNTITQSGEFLATVQTPIYGWLGKSKEKKTPYVVIPLKITDPDFPDLEGKEVDWYGYLSSGSIKRTIETLKNRFGFNGDLEKLLDFDYDPFTGKQVRVAVDESEYNGKITYQAKWLNPVERTGGTKATRDMFPDLAELTREAKTIAAETKVESEEEPSRATPKAAMAPRRTKDDRDQHIVAKGNAYQKQIDEDGDEIPF